MKIYLKKGQLDYFRRKALATPNEILAILIGKRLSPSSVRIVRFEYPLISESSPTSVTSVTASDKEIARRAIEDGLMWIGSIHSHPNALPVMSKVDRDGAFMNNDIVSGIVEVTNRRTRVVFWRQDSSLPCEMVHLVDQMDDPKEL